MLVSKKLKIKVKVRGLHTPVMQAIIYEQHPIALFAPPIPSHSPPGKGIQPPKAIRHLRLAQSY
jgi:hypothetical protein